MVELSSEVVQLLGFFLAIGAVYGGIRSDLKRLHEQASETNKIARDARKRIKRHSKDQKPCPHKPMEKPREVVWNGIELHPATGGHTKENRCPGG